MTGQTRERFLASKSRFIILNGVSMSVADAAASHGLARGTLLQRLARGWPVDRAVQTPARPREARS
jgi:hypothetical protein